LDDVAVRQLGAAGLFSGSHNALPDQVDADAQVLGVLGGVTREKMSVAAADFQDDGRIRRQERREFRPQRRAAGSDVGEELGRVGGQGGSFGGGTRPVASAMNGARARKRRVAEPNRADAGLARSFG